MTSNTAATMTKTKTTTTTTTNNTTETTSHETLLQSQAQPTTVQLILTAFGPFGGVPDNPSMTLLRELPQFLSSSSSSSSSSRSGGWKALVQQRIVQTMVIETSAQGARQAIHRIHEQLLPNVTSMSSSLSSPETVVVRHLCLHLGVNASAQRGEFQLETCAYNDATFRIPDEQGYRPYHEPIVSHVTWASPLSTSLLSTTPTTTATSLSSTTTTTTMTVLEDLVHQLSQTFPTLDSRISTNPGRFVCNYLYYLSLNQWQSPHDDTTPSNGTTTTTTTTTTSHSKDTPTGKTGTSLFVHIPPFEQVPKDIQLEYLAELMRILCGVELQ